jgi:hypothetical protein
MGTGPLSSGLSRPKREGDYAVPSSAVVKEWRYIYAGSMGLYVGYLSGHNESKYLNLKKNCYTDLVKRINIKIKGSGKKCIKILLTM